MSSRLGEFANIYELLDESDSSGVESGKKAKEAVEQKKAAAAAALAPPTATKPTNTQGQKPAGDRRSPRTDRPPRGPRTEGDRPPRPEGERRPRPPRPEGDRPPRQEGERRPRPEGDRPRRPRPVEGGENSFAESGQATARGEPRAHLPRDQVRGPRPDRGYERRHNGDQDTRPGKREYDRRSGTGRGKETAKGGAGAGNWGSDEAEVHSLEGQSAAAAAAVADGTPKEGGEEATAETPAAPAENTEAAAPADDEPAVRTLAAYLSDRKSTTAAQASRKAGDGEDSAAYANYQPIKKEEESLFSFEKASKEKKAKETKETKENKEKRVAADEVLRFQAERRERDNREERGGSRGGRGGRGGQGGQRRGGNSQGSDLNFTDAAAFPGLSTKA